VTARGRACRLTQRGTGRNHGAAGSLRIADPDGIVIELAAAGLPR